MSTLFKNFLQLPGEPPRPPSIDRFSRRCQDCDRRAYRREEAAGQAARDLGYGRVAQCEQGWCGHFTLADPPQSPAPPPPKHPASSRVCARSGKAKYRSETLAEAAAGQFNHWNRPACRKRGERVNLRSYQCGHCGEWHLTKND